MHNPPPGVLPRNNTEPADSALDRVMSTVEQPVALADTADSAEPSGARIFAALAGTVHLAVATGVGVACAHSLVVSLRGLHGNFDGAGALGVFAFLAIIFAFAIGMALFLAVALGLAKLLGYPDEPAGIGTLLVIDLLGVFFVWSGMVAPMHKKEQVDVQRAVAEQSAQLAWRNAEFKDWTDKIRASGAHAPPGVVPPILRVEDDGVQAFVKNTDDLGMTLRVSRVLPGDTAGTWRHCRMTTDASPSRSATAYPRYEETSVAPGDTYLWVPESHCADAFRGAPLEYRIGSYRDARAWWSDSALDTAPQWHLR